MLILRFVSVMKVSKVELKLVNEPIRYDLTNKVTLTSSALQYIISQHLLEWFALAVCTCTVSQPHLNKKNTHQPPLSEYKPV